MRLFDFGIANLCPFVRQAFAAIEAVYKCPDTVIQAGAFALPPMSGRIEDGTVPTPFAGNAQVDLE
jgi:hypothetical protein